MFRTGFSFRLAVGTVDDVLKRLGEIDIGCAPIADRFSTFAYARWAKAAKKVGLRPVFGIELPVILSFGQEQPSIDFWTFLAIDDIAAINELVWLASSNPGHEHSILMEQAIKFPGVIKIAGPAVQIDAIPKKVPKDFYIGISPATPRGIARAAMKRKLPLIAMSANYYPQESDREFFRVAMGKNANVQTYPQHILSDDEWKQATAELIDPPGMNGVAQKSALDNRRKALVSCKAMLKKAELLKPDNEKTLRQLCEEGAKKLNIDLNDEVYAKRLERELSLIAEKKFEDYFFIIADMVNWAKERMVVGPARGSSCGSLVCYLIGITAIDPIPFGLLFERFIDTTRSDLPDIDLDFSDVNRQKVFDYVEEKYGMERVARLGTVGTFMPRSALHQAGIALKIPRWQIDKVLDNIIVRSSGDSRALQQLEDTLKDTEAGRSLLHDFPNVVIAGRMEGHPNVSSQHAAGIVLTEGTVRDIVAVDARTKSTMCDKRDAEELNLLKIDALGLTQLSIFERTLQLIGEPPVSGFLETVPLDDPKAFDVLNKGHFSGVFQFMGGALQSLAKQTTFTQLSDLVAITALARPGPMATGGANLWVKRKRGLEPVSYPHDMLEPYLKETLGVVVYQEQVMQIAREIGELSWDDVTQLRKAMSKSMGEEFFDRFGDPWKAAAIRKGMTPEVANAFWKDLCAFGSWGFNKSHAVAYGTVSYWCCWLKAHHPVEFAAATLDAESDPMKQIQLLREMEAEGIGYIPIDADHSTDKWEPKELPDGRRILVGPLTNIHGIGPATVRAIMNARSKKGPKLSAPLAKKLSEPKTPIDTLYPVTDRVAKLHPDLKAIKIYTEPTPIKQVQTTGQYHEVVVIGVARRIVPRDRNELVLIARRGGKRKSGPTAYLNIFLGDDTDEIMCTINERIYPSVGKPIVERGRAGKSIYAFKGLVPKDFRMIDVKAVKYLGDLDVDDDQAD